MQPAKLVPDVLRFCEVEGDIVFLWIGVRRELNNGNSTKIVRHGVTKFLKFQIVPATSTCSCGCLQGQAVPECGDGSAAKQSVAFFKKWRSHLLSRGPAY